MNNMVLEKIHQIYITKKYVKGSVMPSKVWVGLWCGPFVHSQEVHSIPACWQEPAKKTMVCACRPCWVRFPSTHTQVSDAQGTVPSTLDFLFKSL